MNTLSKRNSFLIGMGGGFLIAAFIIKLFSLMWLVVSVGVLLLIVGGTGVFSKDV